ncbi:MAG: hypothetical protein Q4P20_00445 [Eubacteriales bacterium]|nr:hypothetical protein [Eubacteriales bacterium]
MIIKTHQADKLRRFVRILTLLCVCLLLVGIPASAARMGSVDINGSEVAYQAQYKAYTEAASGDDAVVCKFTVSNPTAGKNGALCRIILPQSQNVYLYMDAGDLAVMRYDGSEYKKFCADYQLKRGTTYTLCVFRDGLVFFDGTRCYTYSGNLYGFTDVIAGWSGESNVFSTTLTKQAPTSDTASEDTEDDEETVTTEEPAPSTAAAADPYPPIWVILALVLGTSSNLLALAALHSSNLALRTVRRSAPRTGYTSRPATKQKQKPPAKKPATSKRPPQKKSATSAARTASHGKSSPPPAMSQPSAKPKQKPKIFFPPEEKAAPTAKPSAQPTQPYDLYTGTFWQTYAEKFKPYRFGDPARGYCTFVRGNSPASDLFVLSSDSFIWLNPVRFHTTSPQHGVRIRMAEAAGISMAFDFCHVGTGKRELALSQDVEMVNFQPAHVVKGSHGAYELSERGIIVFEMLG